MHADVEGLKRATRKPLNETGPGGPGGPSPVAERIEALDQSEEAAGPGGPELVQFRSVAGYVISKDGVFEVPQDENKPEVRLTLAACGVVAHCRDGRRENWGAYLEWVDRDGVLHEAAFPVGRFHEPGGTLAAELANQGLPIVPGMERRLLRYFANCTPPARFRAAIQTGWQDGTDVFVLPTESIGGDGSAERVVYQPERFSPTGQSVRTGGTQQDWGTNVAALCEGNPLLVLFLSAALAAPLFHLLRQEGGGLHAYGLTSGGKTTAQQVAASAYGDGSDPAAGRSSTFVKKWNQTKNATEGLAEAHNDLPLCLDEIGEADARDFGRMIYQLAGGQGKGRMRADATLKAAKVWRIMLLSTGELPASDMMESEGKPMKGGQAVRLLDIPSTDPLTGQGIIVNTHGAPNPASFVDTLKRSCSTHYGWAGPAFIKALVNEGLPAVRAELQAALDETVRALTPPGASAEVQRAVKRFALIAVAGEKAASLGILPWTQGEAVRATKIIFGRYLAARGGVGSDTERAVEQVRAFLLAHGSSRFRDLDNDDNVRVVNLAGYRDVNKNVFYLTPQGFKEACRGHGVIDVARLLAARGLLQGRDPEHLTVRETVRGVGRTRLYAVSADILDGASLEAMTTGPLDRSTI
jgi:putative DNA primase/helicase